MRCRDCPYGREDFERRMYSYEKTVQEKGIPNDIYKNLNPEDAADEFEQFVWCDKVGGKTCCFGKCGDYSLIDNTSNFTKYTYMTETDYKKRKRRKRFQYNKRYESHLKFRVDHCNYYPSMVIPRNRDGNNLWLSKTFPEWSDDEKDIAYYKKCYRGNHNGNRYQFYKKYANKVVRRYKGEIHKGNGYKKCFDYWWIVD